jgi:predicted transcriptional regulator
MQRTLYVRPEDEPFWRAIEKLAEAEQRSVSYLVGQALRAYLEQQGQPV